LHEQSDSNRQPKAFFVNLVEEHMQQQQNAKAKTPTPAPRTPRLAEPGSASRPSAAGLFLPANAVNTPHNASSKKLPAGAVASAFAQASASASKRPASNSPTVEASPAIKAPPKFGIPSPFLQASKVSAADPGSPYSPPLPPSVTLKTPRTSTGPKSIVKPIQLSPACPVESPPIPLTPMSAFRPIDDVPISSNAVHTPIFSSASRQRASVPKEQPAPASPQKSPQAVKTVTSSAIQSPAQDSEPMSTMNLILLGIVAFVLSFLFFRFNKLA
jgi:hypothetical protein